MPPCRAILNNLSRIAVVAAAASVFATAAQAFTWREANPPAERRMLPYTGVLPPCDDADVLLEISQGFQAREGWFWNSPLGLVQFQHVAETGYRNNGESYIPRRYCKASALFSDGRERRVMFNIAEQTGTLGFVRGVTWCVVGLDRNHAFSPACRATGP